MHLVYKSTISIPDLFFTDTFDEFVGALRLAQAPFQCQKKRNKALESRHLSFSAKALDDMRR